MHQKNYMNDMNLAKYYKDISDTFSSMAQGEYQMYQMHSGQTQGTGQQMPPMQGMQQQMGMPQMQGMQPMQGMPQMQGMTQQTPGQQSYGRMR
jgi:hypothetical protein